MPEKLPFSTDCKTKATRPSKPFPPLALTSKRCSTKISRYVGCSELFSDKMMMMMMMMPILCWQPYLMVMPANHNRRRQGVSHFGYTNEWSLLALRHPLWYLTVLTHFTTLSIFLSLLVSSVGFGWTNQYSALLAMLLSQHGRHYFCRRLGRRRSHARRTRGIGRHAGRGGFKGRHFASLCQ